MDKYTRLDNEIENSNQRFIDDTRQQQQVYEQLQRHTVLSLDPPNMADTAANPKIMYSYLAVQTRVRTPTGVTCKGVCQLEATYFVTRNISRLEFDLQPAIASQKYLLACHPNSGRQETG